MKTGEGKTLVATLPVLPQRARPAAACTSSPSTITWPRRDSEWMGRVYKFLGLTVGVIQHGHGRSTSGRSAYRCRHHLRHEQRIRLRLSARQHEVRCRATAFSASITSRSSTKSTRSSSTKRERRSSSPARARNRPTSTTASTRSFRSSRQRHRLQVDEKHRTVDADRRRRRARRRSCSASTICTIPAEHGDRCTTSIRRLRAHTLYKRDVEYVVKDGEVIIVDEFTGRLMPGRRW